MIKITLLTLKQFFQRSLYVCVIRFMRGPTKLYLMPLFYLKYLQECKYDLVLIPCRYFVR